MLTAVNLPWTKFIPLILWLTTLLAGLVAMPVAAAADPAKTQTAVGHTAHPVERIVFGYPHQLVDPQTLYPIRLLRAALEQSAQPFELIATPVPMVQERSLREIAAGHEVDVFWSMTSAEREQQLLPIRIPIDKGLFGWRLLLLRQDQAELTQGISTLAQLRRLVFLQGYDWPDSRILQSNQLKLVTSHHYRAMFNMIQSQRADVFPRSVLEVWAEKEQEQHQLVIDQRLALYYPTALYFFVNKHRQALALRIEQGLEQLIRSGEFDRIFMQEYGEAIREAEQSNRRVILLHNPLLPAATPLSRKELWYQLPAQFAPKLRN